MKHLLLGLTIFSFIADTFCQDTFHKLIYFNYPELVTFRGVSPTDSCFYVIGNFTDTVSPVTSGVLISKISINGNLELFKIFNNPGTDVDFENTYSDLLATSDGYLLTAGGFYDTTSNAQIRIFNTMGDTVLTKSFRSILYPEHLYLVVFGIQRSGNGDYAVLIGYETNENPHDADISLLILDSMFQIKAYTSYANSTKYELSRSLNLDNDGGYIIGAVRTNAGQVDMNFTSRTLIIKTDSLGVEQWQYLSPGNKLQDEAKAMIKTPDGGLVVASGIGGEYWNNPANPHELYWDALIFKLDANRNEEWRRLLRGYTPTGQTALTEIVAAPDGSGYVACGITTDSIPGKWPYHDSWLVKVSPEGDSIWARHYAWFDGEFVAPDAWDMKATPDSGYVVVGYSLNVGQHVPGWIMKVDKYGCLIPGCNANDGTGTTTEEDTAVKLAIYPNPTSDLLNFQLQTTNPVSDAVFRIINAEGKMIKEIKTAYSQATFSVPVRDWAAGTYFIQCFQDNLLLATNKFIVSH